MRARTAVESEKGHVTLIYAIVLWTKKKRNLVTHRMSSESGRATDVYWQVEQKKK